MSMSWLLFAFQERSVYLFRGIRRCDWDTSAADDADETVMQLVDGAIVSDLIVSGVDSTVKRKWNVTLKETVMKLKYIYI